MNKVDTANGNVAVRCLLAGINGIAFSFLLSVPTCFRSNPRFRIRAMFDDFKRFGDFLEFALFPRDILR